MKPIIIGPALVLALAGCEPDTVGLEEACREAHAACLAHVRADCERDKCARTARIATCDLDYELCTPYPSKREP